MSDFIYTPDKDVKVHEEGAIRLICKPFQSHESGLPELVKNSADAYSRENVDSEDRIIIVSLQDGKGRSPASISCIDFVGMTSEVIEQDFRHWADPDAATRRAENLLEVQGGHGNGGKCYMTQMFEDHALAHTVRNGKGCKYGVVGGSITFGYIPDKADGRDFSVPDTIAELMSALGDSGITLAKLDTGLRSKLEKSRGFTVVRGVGPRGLKRKIKANDIIEALIGHVQMIRTLELCRVYVFHNGEMLNEGLPLSLPEIEPMEDVDVRKIPIPSKLKDPQTGDTVSTIGDGSLPEGVLDLLTSAKSMRWKNKMRHVVSFRSNSGYIGYIPVRELDVESAYRDRIYGECTLQALDQFKQNDRARLASSPLVRAVEAFISSKVEDLAREFEKKDERKYDRKERNALSEMNEALDQWKNRFLNRFMTSGGGIGVNPPPPPPTLPSGVPNSMELQLSHTKAGVNVSLRPRLRFFDKNGRQIKATEFRWVSEDTNVALVDDDLTVINTFSPGRTNIYAETSDGKLTSNKVELEVVHIHDVRIVPDSVEVRVSGRQRLRAICQLADRTESDEVNLVWTEDDPTCARVSAAGFVFGFTEGETTVIAGDDHFQSKPAHIKVIPAASGPGPGTGSGYPRVLVSDIDPDPDTGEQVTFSEDDPPVWQRVQDADRHIWWINTSAPLARLFLDQKEGYGYGTREWRIYMLERYVEVMAQISILTSSEVSSHTGHEWIMEWGSRIARIQSLAADDLSDFINTGSLPGQ